MSRSWLNRNGFEDRKNEMKVAFGLKAHSGWAALVVVGGDDDKFVVVDRRRIDLVEEEWAKQPYHAAEDLKPVEARLVVKRGIDAAYRIAVRELRVAVKRERGRGNEITACAVLVGNPMPGWNTDEILAVHFRMHQAEGVLFRDALAGATRKCGLKLFTISEKQLASRELFGVSVNGLAKKVPMLGKSIGPPWAKDQKDAALAAIIALQATEGDRG